MSIVLCDMALWATRTSGDVEGGVANLAPWWPERGDLVMN